jgi:hypothetical protein
MFVRSTALRCLLVLAVACGKPVDPSGKEDASFTKASMGFENPAPQAEPSRPLAADLAVEPVSMLVMFNRLHTPDKLQDVLNKKPGQFSRIDVDKDSTPDPLTVLQKDTADGHAFEIHARPTTGEFVVATMLFDKEWSFMGHYNGVMGGAASTFGNPLLSTGTPAPLPTVNAAPAPAPVATTPVATPDTHARGRHGHRRPRGQRPRPPASTRRPERLLLLGGGSNADAGPSRSPPHPAGRPPARPAPRPSRARWC